MKKAYLIFFVLTLKCFSQAPDILWQKCFGGTSFDYSSSITITPDGGYIFAGVSNSIDGDVFGNQGGYDFSVVKLSNTGTIQWQKSLGGTLEDAASKIIPTSDGGYITVGYTDSNDGDVSGNHGYRDAWVVKLSNLGAIQWQKCVGGGVNSDYLYSIVQTSDGGYVAAGGTYSNDGDLSGNHGAFDAWVIKLSNVGTVQWQKCLGGTSNDNAKSIVQTLDGGYIIAGYAGTNDGDISGNHGYRDSWIVKLSNLGDIQWQKCLGGSNNDEANYITQTLDGGYVVAGYADSNDGDVFDNHGYRDAWVVKLSSLGTILWQKCLGGSNGDGADSLEITSDGGYVMACSTQSNDGDVSGNHGSRDAWVVKLSNLGIIQWQKCLGGSTSDVASSIALTQEGGYIIAGGTQSNDGDVLGNNGGANDAWIVKLNADGLSTTVFNQDTLRIYPNPVTDVVQLNNTNLLSLTSVIITDLSGKMVLEQTTINNQINVEQLANGMYIIEAFSGNQKSQSKFIKQ
jgi:hypothetical protein